MINPVKNLNFTIIVYHYANFVAVFILCSHMQEAPKIGGARVLLR